jgi:hypothetical protein
MRLTPGRTDEPVEEMWVGTYGTRHGYPDPEAELFVNAQTAKEWALTPPAGALVVEAIQNPWMVGASYRVRDGQEEAVAHRAKVIG